MNIEVIKKLLKENKQPEFRLKQITKAVYRDGVSSFGEITTLSKSLGHEMSKLRILSFEVERILEAEDKESAKAVLRLKDGNIIETVLISPKPGMYSVCVSTQVGCPMNCGFCATGKGGLKRNLTAEEIMDQVLFWKQWLRSGRTATSGPATSSLHSKKFKNLKLKIKNYDVSNIVYMGMGEPFLNWEAVKESLENLVDKKLFGFGSRSISVSTSGIPKGIINFGKIFSQMNLALSLHFADDQKRSEFMPVNKKYNLADLKKALQDYFQITNRKVFIEYIMLNRINDSQEDAEKLVQYLHSIGSVQLLHVNLIGYNSVGGNLKSSSGNKIHTFKKYLVRNKINATIRKSLGEEIQGACGQLSAVQLN